MKRDDMIAEIKQKYCGKCPVHLNKMRSSELEGLLRGGGARGGESRLQPENRIIGKFTPQKAPKINSNQYEKNIGEKKDILKTRRRAGDLASINARMRTPRPPMNTMRDDLKGAIRGAKPSKPKLSEEAKKIKKIMKRKQTKFNEMEKKVREQFKENDAMGGEDINRAASNEETAKAERRKARRIQMDKDKKESKEKKQAKFNDMNDKANKITELINDAKAKGDKNEVTKLQSKLDKLKRKITKIVYGF